MRPRHVNKKLIEKTYLQLIFVVDDFSIMAIEVGVGLSRPLEIVCELSGSDGGRT